MKTINIELLKEILTMEKVYFEYKKRDGTVRKAFGTLQYAFIPEDKHPKDSLYESSNVRFFDLEKGEWRSISKNVKEVDVEEQ
jgi:WYL_2, Sm-like SH3 beta-barrel fold